MPSVHRPTALAALGFATILGSASCLTGLVPPASAPALAQGTPGILEYRWENSKDYRKLYFYISSTGRQQRADYYLILRPNDRKTAILKLTVTIPKYFDGQIDPKQRKLCRMSEGGMLKRTRCEKTIPATIEIAKDGKTIEVFPETPVSDKDTIGLFLRVYNPSNVGLFQFNALAQAPGELPVSGYLGSWLIQIEAN